MRNWMVLGLTATLVASLSAQVVLGDGKGKVRAVNALAQIAATENSLEWSRRDFQDAANSSSFGFWPGYTIQVAQDLFDALGNQVGFGDSTNSVSITTVDSLVTAGWPSSFSVPESLFRQGGAYTNNSANGDHNPIGAVWIKYELDDSNPDGWNVRKVQIFAWDVRDLIHKPSTNK
ncbi:hypothetical protein GXSOP10_119245, partial [Armatimonadetes bacterium GXS]